MISGTIGKFEISSSEPRRTHIRELYYFTLFVSGREVGKVSFFVGREFYPPWIELDYDPWPREVGIEADLFKVFYDTLDCNGKLFVTYDRDKETEQMIIRGFSPLDTPLGKSMLKAGFSWFKAWYIPEGGNEGSAKIQGNKTCNTSDSIRQLKEALEDVKTEEAREIILNRIEYLRKSGHNALQ